jgi:hypothetical protein
MVELITGKNLFAKKISTSPTTPLPLFHIKIK